MSQFHIARKMGVVLAPSKATEALFVTKGEFESMELTLSPEEVDKLVVWFTKNLPILRPVRKNYLT